MTDYRRMKSEMPTTSAVSELSRSSSQIAPSRLLLAACAVIAIVSTSILAWKAAEILSGYAYILTLPVCALLAVSYLLYRARSIEIQRHQEKLGKLYQEAIEALATAIDARDEITHDHVQRVRIYARGLAQIFKLSAAEMEALHAGALLHDLGKLGVPDHILNKPGLLTPGEFEKMKMHTLVGAEILNRIKFPYPVVPIVRSHHERWDGNGYPDRLRGEEIPMTARILSVVDCFDAVRENRPYRRGLTREEAIAMLRKGSSGQFDPRVVETFVENLSKFEAEINLARAGYHQQAQERINWHDPAVREQMLKGNTACPNAGYAIEPVAEGLSVIEKMKSAHTEVAILYEIAHSLGTARDLSEAAVRLHELLQGLIPFDTCAIFISEHSQLCAVAEYVVGWNAEILRKKRAEYGHGITGFVLAQRRVFANTDAHLDFSAAELELSDPFHNILACPLVRGEETMGVLTLYSRSAERYSPDHIRLAETVASALADAAYHRQQKLQNLPNAWLGESLTEDPLTGLPNARSLEISFAEELKQSDQLSAPLLLLSFDIDDFKAFNEQHGHAAGDELLREIAQLLTRAMRRGDLLVRYAADQFVAVLHQSSLQQVDGLKDRIEELISEWQFHSSDQRGNVRLSCAHARHGEDGHSLAELMRTIDERLSDARASRQHAIPPDNLRFFPGVMRKGC
jgi:diguanylate cyclase (GGDEF)-like protein/putative nucleotidyltransferase with HDIG domain